VSPSCRMHVHQFSSTALPSWLPRLSDQASQTVEPNCQEYAARCLIPYS
jgi:hypothetical protein